MTSEVDEAFFLAAAALAVCTLNGCSTFCIRFRSRAFVRSNK